MFSHAVKIATVAGFEIKVDLSWLLIAALIVWSLSSGYFPQVAPDLPQSTYVTLSIVAMLGLFISLTLHELAHSLVARRFDVPINGITLFLFGGVAELGKEPQSAWAEFWIAIAGPALSLALAAIFGLLGVLTTEGLFNALVGYLALLNLVLALFNLIPAFPLDGGRIYRAVLWARHKDFLKATRQASAAGSVFAYFLMGMGVLALFNGGLMTGIWQILIGLFLLTAAKSTYQNQLFKSVFSDKSVDSVMEDKPIYARPDQSLSELVNQVMLRHRVSFVPVVDSDILLGYVDSNVLTSIDRENWSNTLVGDVFVTIDETNSVSPSLAVGTLLETINTSGRRKFLVAEGRHLVGIVTLSDLMTLLAMVQKLNLSNGKPAQDSLWKAGAIQG